MGAETPQAGWLSQVRRKGDQLSRETTPLQLRWTTLLDSAADGTHLAAALLWTLGEARRFQLLAAGGIPRIAPPGGQLMLDATHLEKVQGVLDTDERPVSPWTTPTGTPLVLARKRVAFGEGRMGVLELFFPKEREKEAGWMQLVLDEIGALLLQFAAAAGSPLAAPSASSAVSAPAMQFWAQFDPFVLSLQQSLSLVDTASVAANDGRVLLDCDRVSVAQKTGPRSRILSTSGQEAVQNKANLARRLAELAHQVCELGEPVTYEGSIEGFPPQFAEPLAAFLEESRSRMVMLIPLRENVPHHRIEQDLADRRRLRTGRVFGCLILEQFTESAPQPGVRQYAPLIADHVAAALSNARDHESIFLMPVWRAIGRTVGWFRGRRLAIAGAILAAVVAVGLGLAFIPWEYRVEAKGRAMPVEQHEIFAPWDGRVERVLVENGQQVSAGEPLVVLRSDDLETELLAAENAVLEGTKHVESLRDQRRRADAKRDLDESLRVAAELRKTEIERDGAELRAEKFRERRDHLTVRAPVRGVVATFQVRQNLLDRPVKRGDRLLEVMNVDGPWRLELDVPEYRMGHVLSATASAAPTAPLVVDYVAATAVSQGRVGRLGEIGSRSNESQEEGTVVEAFVDIDADDLPGRRIGAEVTAKIHCGPRSLGYVLFGDVLEFVQRKVWW